jgi:hypothetical protein
MEKVIFINLIFRLTNLPSAENLILMIETLIIVGEFLILRSIIFVTSLKYLFVLWIDCYGFVMD